MFDSRDIRRALGEPDFSRGLEYFERGMVCSVEFETRSLDFTIDDCRALLSLYGDCGRASSDVKAVAEHHLRRGDAKIAELEGLQNTLARLVARCHGDDRPDCPILDDLAGSRRRSGT